MKEGGVGEILALSLVEPMAVGCAVHGRRREAGGDGEARGGAPLSSRSRVGAAGVVPSPGQASPRTRRLRRRLFAR